MSVAGLPARRRDWSAVEVIDHWRARARQSFPRTLRWRASQIGPGSADCRWQRHDAARLVDAGVVHVIGDLRWDLVGDYRLVPTDATHQPASARMILSSRSPCWPALQVVTLGTNGMVLGSLWVRTPCPIRLPMASNGCNGSPVFQGSCAFLLVRGVAAQPCQGGGRGFESRRPLQPAGQRHVLACRRKSGRPMVPFWFLPRPSEAVRAPSWVPVPFVGEPSVDLHVHLQCRS